MKKLVVWILVTVMVLTSVSALAETSRNEELLEKARKAARWLEENDTADSAALNAFCAEIGVAEICAVDENAIIVISSVAEYIGYDMSSSDQSAWFLQILEDPALELVQEPMPRGFDDKAVRQFVGVYGGVPGGFTQVGFIPE